MYLSMGGTNQTNAMGFQSRQRANKQNFTINYRQPPVASMATTGTGSDTLGSRKPSTAVPESNPHRRVISMNVNVNSNG